jgi:hypothetical protein
MNISQIKKKCIIQPEYTLTYETLPNKTEYINIPL